MIQYPAMRVFDWNRVAEEELNPLFFRKAIHGTHLTVARFRVCQSAVVPLHSHANEQISMVETGALLFVVDGEERILRAGEVLQIPPNTPHRVEALEDSTVTDLFSPPREDWIRGDDTYLRDSARK